MGLSPGKVVGPYAQDLNSPASHSVTTGGVLTARQVTVRFGGLTAIAEIDLELGERELLGLIGPNGAGKTTLVNVLTGFQAPTRGEVAISGRRMTGRSPAQFARSGIARSFQAVRLFRDLSVRQNLEVGATNAGVGSRFARRRAHELLSWIGLADRASDIAGTLSYGEERLVGLVRGLATNPRFLLLDEPAAGMNESECQHLMECISAIPATFGCGVLVIEHNMRVVMGVCERIHVIAGGMTIADGTPEAVQRDRTVIDAYLGQRRHRGRRARVGHAPS